MSDPYDLQRFVDAQESVIDDVRAELSAGRKRTHWMWFVFPQIAGLGHSAMAQHYAISSRDEARAYLAHPVLGARLVELTRIVNGVQGRSVSDIFGYPDDMKFHSSMTLFAHTADDAEVFNEALRRYFEGRADEATLSRLQ
ncbi:calpastatin [Caballeronia jiangsuensis]|nr:calpastatin [Caballeronia jiangsuensis]